MIANDGLSSPLKNNDRIGHNGWMPTKWGRNVINKIFHLILVTMLASVAMAQDVSVRADHPDEYVVVKGDTLWDISGKFLEKPWQWPSIWQANPQIANPHLIYPGDRLSLVYIDGQPRLVVNGDDRTVKLSPGARRTATTAIQPVEWDAIKSFVTNARVFKPEDLQDLPYVVANEDSRMLAGETDLTYVRGLSGRIGEEFAIVRLRNIYYDDDGNMVRALNREYKTHHPVRLEYPGTIWSATGNWRTLNPPVLGYEYWDISVARVMKTGDPAVLQIQSGRTEVKPGDFVLPLDDYVHPKQFMPHAMDAMPEGMKVIALTQTSYGSGHYQIVAINAGRQQGVELGHVFSAFREGKLVQDSVKTPKTSRAAFVDKELGKVKLPDQYSGHILVFRVFDEVSYAMIMDGDRPVREFDILKHASETL